MMNLFFCDQCGALKVRRQLELGRLSLAEFTAQLQSQKEMLCCGGKMTPLDATVDVDSVPSFDNRVRLK